MIRATIYNDCAPMLCTEYATRKAVHANFSLCKWTSDDRGIARKWASLRHTTGVQSLPGNTLMHQNTNVRCPDTPYCVDWVSTESPGRVSWTQCILPPHSVSRPHTADLAHWIIVCSQLTMRQIDFELRVQHLLQFTTEKKIKNYFHPLFSIKQGLQKLKHHLKRK